MVTKEQALEWAKESGVVPRLVTAHGEWFAQAESLVRRVHAEGQREMRERAFMALVENEQYYCGKTIRALEIEE